MYTYVYVHCNKYFSLIKTLQAIPIHKMQKLLKSEI